jgi:hypothetical protein
MRPRKTSGDYMEQLRRITKFRIGAMDVYSDGDCDDRRLALLVRS